MSRLYVFAIGGTGSRVLKSLTMLLASSVSIQSKTEYEIVPIIIDPHKSNDDLKRTQRLLGNYQYISNKVGADNGFFNTKITTLDQLTTSENRLSDSFTFNLQEVANKKFSDYIDYNHLDEQNRALANILFSGQSINKRGEQVNLLDVEMDIGFVGNPNIGSVVLNQFKDSDEFKEVASNYRENDRIFIISSIFGGTGAAGFPTILKNIRNAMQNKHIDSKGFLQNAKIGAITVLPYFNVEKDNDSPIQKSDFIAKTKAALYYYKENVAGNNSVNALYYIADDHNGKPYKNDPGENGQKNNAHFIELAAAISIIDFLGIPDDRLVSIDGKAVNPIYKEFAIKNDADNIKFSDFEAITEKNTALPLSQLALFRKFVLENMSDEIEKQRWSLDKPEIDKSFIHDNFFKTYLTEFLDAYGQWLTEMSENRRGFTPFNINSSLDAFIKDRPAKAGWLSKVDYAMFNNKLSAEVKNKTYHSAEQKLIKLFYETTHTILTEKFGFK